MLYSSQKQLENRDNDEKGSDDDDYVPYVPVKDRRKQLLQKHGGRLGLIVSQSKVSCSSVHVPVNSHSRSVFLIKYSLFGVLLGIGESRQ